MVEEDQYDGVLSDFDMPEMTGVELLEEVREFDEDIPFILYTGKGSEEVAAEAVNHGVTDYFRKEAGSDHYQMIAQSMVGAIEGYRDRAEKEVFEAVVEYSENPILITDTESSIVYVNQAVLDATGYDRDELLGENPRMLNSEVHGDELFESMYRALENGEVFEIDDMTNVDKNGDEYLHDQQVIPITLGRNCPEFYAAISDLKEAEI